MKKVVANSVVVKGDLNGGEIEPGTFHIYDTQNSPAAFGNEERNKEDANDHDVDDDGQGDMDPEKISFH